MRKFLTFAQNPGVATQPGFCFAKVNACAEDKPVLRAGRPPLKHASSLFVARLTGGTKHWCGRAWGSARCRWSL